MNTLFQNITAAVGLTLSLGLVSCEKDNLPTPNPAGTARLGAVTDDISAGIPQVRKLTRFGNAILSYSDNGQIRKVTAARGNGDTHTDYTYAPGSIRAASYQGSALVRDETFTIDASGRCTESVVKGSYSDTHWVYTYNEKGQLWSCQNKNSCIGGTGYVYNADGDLTQATVATSALSSSMLTFAYVLPKDANYYYETYPLNLNVPLLPEHDTFLPIFGKPGKHLVKRVSYTPSGSAAFPAPSDRFYSYVIPSDGFVAERNMAHTFGGSSVEKTLYEYMMTDIKLH